VAQLGPSTALLGPQYEQILAVLERAAAGRVKLRLR
jgi:hypothetical protein